MLDGSVFERRAIELSSVFPVTSNQQIIRNRKSRLHHAFNEMIVVATMFVRSESPKLTVCVVSIN